MAKQKLDARSIDRAALEAIRIRAVRQVQAGESPEDVIRALGFELRFMVVKGGVGAAVFIRFLKRLIHGAKRPIFLIVDGHPAHRAKAVTQYIRTVSQRLRLFFLPAYSPELNPDEQLWNDVKNNAVGRSRLEQPEDMHRTVVGRLRFLQKSPERVRSFFQMPETRYAA